MDFHQSETKQQLDEIVSSVAVSKKYRALCPDTIRRLAERELAVVPHANAKAAVKATKRRLHQVYGAFEEDFDIGAAYRRLEAAYQTGSDAEIKAACRYVLGLHSSTRERLPILDRFYPAIFEVTGHPNSILDLGCGLNPLSLPWMGLPSRQRLSCSGQLVSAQGSGRAPQVRYVALDIDAGRIGFLNRYLVLAGLEPLSRCQDLLAHPPDDAADVALLLKMSPSLERQEPGATLRLIDHLRAPFVVASFAVKSLGGREKGMVEHYQRQFLKLAEDRKWLVEKLVFATELLFIVKHQT
jgi:16S rRNA (guanine(1405)-N(7))-methyltransferase